MAAMADEKGKRSFLNTFSVFGGWFSACLATGILLLLGVASLFQAVCPNRETFRPELTDRAPLPALAAALALMILFVLCAKLLLAGANQAQKQKRSAAVVVAVALWSFAFGLAWYYSVHGQPLADQHEAWNTAICLAKEMPQRLNQDYLRTWPQQSGIAMLLEPLARLFGEQSFPFWGYAAALCAAAATLGSCAFCRQLSQNPLAVTICALLCAAFLPVPLYTPFVYGTLPALALVPWGLYGTVRFCREGKGYWWGLAFVSLVLAVVANNGVLIVSIAAMLAMVFTAFRAGKWPELGRCLLAGIVLAAGVCMSQPAVQAIFRARMGIEAQDSMPKLAWVAMGVHSDSVEGPGSYDGYSWSVFWENNANAAATEAAVKADLARYWQEYRSDPSKLSFFIKKTAYQWLDPWFGSLVMSKQTEQATPYGALAEALYGGALFAPAQAWLLFFMSMVYFTAAAGCLILCRKSGGAVWIQVSVIAWIGGFLFQLVWESKSRYCIPYFCGLLPIAAIGLATLEKIPQKWQKQNKFSL